MKLQTKYLGEIEIDKSKVINFPNGLPGFTEEHEFIILDLPNNPAFQLLQSTNTTELAFVMTNPYLIYTDYELKLDEDLLELLKIKEEKDVLVYTIVTLQNPFQDSTINLKAPIIINVNELLGKQYILNDHTYSSKAAIVPTKEEA